MVDVIIFDLDGTLADCRHRLHHVTQHPKDWDAFFAGISADEPHDAINELLGCVHNSWVDGGLVRPIFCSGRPETYREVTQAWIFEHCGIEAPLYMRPAGDQRQDAVVKLELLAKIKADGFNPILAIDDRPQVIEAWRSAGIPVLAVVGDHSNADEATQYRGETLLTVMVGPSGSGKSRWCSLNVDGGSVLSSDQIRAEICGDFRDQSQNDRVFRVMHDVARCRLRNGLPVVLDATHLRRKDRLAAAALAPKGTRVRYVVVERTMEQRKRDAGWREDVPGLLEKHDQTFRSQRADIMAGDHLGNVDVVHVVGE